MKTKLLLVVGTLLLTPRLLSAGDLTSPSYTLRGVTLGGGGGVGMVSELTQSNFGIVGATLGQGDPIDIGQDDLLTTTLEAGFWPIVAALAPLDTDVDTIPDTVDNCTERANPDQLDADGDGFVGGPDFTLFIGGFNGPPGPSGL